MSDLPAIILETERLLLHAWDDASWDDFIRHTNTPAGMRWLGGVLDDEGVAAFRARIDHYRDSSGHTFWCCRRKDDGGHLAGEVLGMAGLKRANQEGGPQGDHEIGWRFREDSWGYGYAKEAALASRDWAFRELGAPHIIALTVEENAPSWGLMRRIGMQRRKDLDFASKEFGGGTIIAYSLSREDWEQLA